MESEHFFEILSEHISQIFRNFHQALSPIFRGPHTLSLPLAISHLGSCNFSPLSSPLPISHLGTSHYLPNFITTPNCTPRHIQSPLIQPLSLLHPIRHLKNSDPPTTFPILLNFTPGHLPLSTKNCHHPPFHTIQFNVATVVTNAFQKI